ncbi:MAG: 3-oxoacyl-[acyl-carrier-protein] reductase [Acidaminococcales bacterium]|jgi:3-oxoacyl-[acyl-carrier protein] reductase|nr:3-oxoacyl-[acyl-carrier-protein] reductase [Acidaminococcales bacterium]
MLLEGKTALVTGGSRGIGRACAILLAKEGAEVAVNYAGNHNAAQETCEIIRSFGRRAIAVQANVADGAQVAEMIGAILREFSRIDILVNNAGITKDNILMRMKDEEWEAVIETNLTGMYNCTKAATKLMLKQKYGRIVNMTSVVGVNGNAGQANYAAAKAGVIGFTKAVAKELASRNITANAVAPGFIQTDMTAALSEKNKEEIAKTIPLGVLGQAEDVAQAVLFLITAKYITGQTLHVDGGMVM